VTDDAQVFARLDRLDPQLGPIVSDSPTMTDELRDAARELVDALDVLSRFSASGWREEDALNVARARMRVLKALGETR
jgi:hypothetical protein